MQHPRGKSQSRWEQGWGDKGDLKVRGERHGRSAREELGMEKIFVSYRNSDTLGNAVAIATELRHRYGDDAVFFQLHDSHVAYPIDATLEVLAKCKVLVVVVGPNWVGQDSQSGSRRIDEKGDWIRREVSQGLELRVQGMLVIPILIPDEKGRFFDLDGARLPANLSKISEPKYLQVPNDFIPAAMEKMFAAVDECVAPASPAPVAPPGSGGDKGGSRRVALGVLLLAVLGGLGYYWWSRPPETFLARVWREFNTAENARLDGNSLEASEHYNRAIVLAREVTDKFGIDAGKIQDKLAKAQATMPPVDGSLSDVEASVVSNRGVLNDTATCWWILGESYRRLNQEADATRAYQEAAKLTYARTFSEDGVSVWSPADKALGYSNPPDEDLRTPETEETSARP